MSEVVVAGIGQAPVGEHWDISLRELAYRAIDAARKDAQALWPDALFAGNMLAPVVSRQAQVATLIADFAGLTGIEAATVEAGGASGGAALRLGYLAVASGEVDVCLVVGVEKMTDRTPAEVEAALSSSIDSDYETIQGMTHTAQAALLMQRYLYEYGAPRESFAAFPVSAHANAASNPNAMFRNTIRMDHYNQAGPVCTPLNMLDIAPAADGAAAIILTRPALLPPDQPYPAVRISGSSMASGSIALHDHPDPLSFDAARTSIEKACQQAGITPSDVDLFELHDAYSIYTALSLEATGLARRGEGWRLAQDGQIGLHGRWPISTFGGLKARGNPGGATGVYQAVEAVLQLRQAAGSNQITGARRALIQCLAGPSSNAVTHVLERMDSW